MRLRRATTADARKLSLIGCATFLESFADDHDGDETVAYLTAEQSPEYYVKSLSEPGKIAWLIEEKAGCPVGYAMAVPATLPGSDASRDYELKRIYLLSKWHGGGWGARLYDAVESEARGRGASRLVLSVYVVNLPAQAFYRKRGFDQIGRWIFEGFDASEDFIYAKTL